jgi:hypothetical protein
MPRLLWMLPVGLLQACAGTPVAEQLERSFAVPEDRPMQVAPVQPSTTSPTDDRSTGSAPEAASPAEQNAPTPAISAPVSQDSQEQETAPETTSRPAASQRLPQAPYRITIRLAGADPAAPAEAVTRALREADVGFAVERIERVEP